MSAWAVISPDGHLAWYPLTKTADVQAIVARQCLQKILLAEEIARMGLFLAADDSRMITKQSFIVDAGLS